MQNLNDRNNEQLMVQIIKDTIECYPAVQFINQNPTRPQILRQLIEEEKLLQVLLSYLARCKRSQFAESTRFISEQLEETLSFVYQTVQQAVAYRDPQSFQYVTQLYTINVEDSASALERSLYFAFLANLSETAFDD